MGTYDTMPSVIFGDTANKQSLFTFSIVVKLTILLATRYKNSRLQLKVESFDTDITPASIFMSTREGG